MFVYFLLLPFIPLTFVLLPLLPLGRPRPSPLPLWMSYYLAVLMAAVVVDVRGLTYSVLAW